jgi:seryl-tRNA synthetase
VLQVELDGILAESNKLSKDIGEMMKTVKIESRYLKRKTVLNKEKSKKLMHLLSSLINYIHYPIFQLILYRWVKRLRKT